MIWWRISLVAAALALAALWYADNALNRLEQAQEELDRTKNNVDTYKRIQNADTGNGDVDADTRWLCERAGKRNCGP